MLFTRPLFCALWGVTNHSASSIWLPEVESNCRSRISWPCIKSNRVYGQLTQNHWILKLLGTYQNLIFWVVKLRRHKKIHLRLQFNSDRSIWFNPNNTKYLPSKTKLETYLCIEKVIPKKNFEAFVMTGDRMINLAKTPANNEFKSKYY